MTKKILFGALAIAFAFGIMVTGCEDPDEDSFENHTINLTPAEENNTILLTLNGATWKDPSLDSDNQLKEALLELLLWKQETGIISNLKTMIDRKFTLERENVIKIEFSKESAFGTAHTGSGIITLKNRSGEELVASLNVLTKNMDSGVWTIGKNEPVTITIK